jgi:hypothetical protein
MTDDRIPGTRVPENRLHRASLWLEDMKRTRAGAVVTYDDETMVRELGELADACGLELSGEQLAEGAKFYATNFRQIVFGGRLGVTVVSPWGAMDMGAVILSVWLDGFQHGAATAAGKYGESNEEILRRATDG